MAGAVQAMSSPVGASEGRIRPTVLILLGCYLPGYKSGGPVRSISGLVEKLGDEFDFKVITSDRDLGENAGYAGIEPHRWVSAGKASVLYVPKGNPLTILGCIRSTPHQVLYLNSFFARAFSMIPMWAYAAGALRTRCIVLAPRGEFSPGALGIKPRRKRAYIAVARNLPAYRRVLWHASSEYEGEDIRRVLGSAVALHAAPPLAAERSGVREALKVVTAPDLRSNDAAATDLSLRRAPKARGELRGAFLSRVARKKNLAGAIRLLVGLRGRVTLDVFGPLEDPAYWRECQDSITSLPANTEVRYRGPVEHQDVRKVLSGYDLFFFPTLGENYGHVIVEALLAGCPVLISDQTPWRALESQGVGWDLPLDQPAKFHEALQRCIDMSPEDHATLCANARVFGRRRSEDPEVVAQNRDLFLRALGSGAFEDSSRPANA